MSALVAVARLAARRLAPALVLVPLAAGLALLVDTASPTVDGIDDVSLARAANGARVATVLAWSSAAAIVAVAVLTVWSARLRGDLADGLLAIDVSRLGWSVATWCGGSLAIALALFVATGLGFAGGARSHAQHRVVNALASPTLALLEANEARSLELEPSDVEDATRLRAQLVALPGNGPVAVVSLTLRRGDERRRAEGRVWSRRTLEVDVPPGEGPLVVTLARLGEGAAVALDANGLTALAPTTSPFASELALLLRALLGLTAACALVLGLVPWLSPLLSFGLVGATFVAAWSGSWTGWPGGDLFAAGRAVASGVAPALLPSASTLAVWALVVAAGLAVATAAPRTAREAGA